MAADGAAASWLVDTFAPSALRWPALGAGQIDELRSALQLIHTQAVFGAETGASSAAQLPAWTQRLQQMARSAIPDVRWAACCLAGATARTAGAGALRGQASTWLAALLPLTKSSEPRTVQSIAASAATDLLARCQGCAQQAKVDSPAALARLMPALASLRGVAQHQAEALKATFALLRASGSQLRPYTAEIEQSCVMLLSSGDDEVRQSAALCLASVPAVTASPKDDFAEWLRVFRKLTDQLRALLDQWLPAPAATAGASAVSGGLNAGTKKGVGGPVEDGAVAARQVNGLCVAIGGMLHLPFVGLVQVPLGELVQLIAQVLGVSQPAAHGEEGIAAVLPTLHTEVLQLLAVLAKAVGRRLLPFAVSLGEMLRVAICRPRKTLVGRSPAVQHAALVTATVCLGLLRSALAATLGRPVLQHIIGFIDSGMGNGTDADAQFQENGTAAGRSASRGQGSARKRRGRRSSALDAGSGATESLASSSRSETALWLASTRLLRRIVDCCGTELQDKERLQLDRAVVGWLVKYGLGGADGLGYVPAMSAPMLRLELYTILAASLECPIGAPGVNDDDQQIANGGSDQLVTPAGNREGPTRTGADDSVGRILPHLHPIARQLFLAGSCNDPSPAVRTACADGLRLCSNLSQPRARPLHFPPPGSQVAEPVTLASADGEDNKLNELASMQVSAPHGTSIQPLMPPPETSTALAAPDTTNLAQQFEAPTNLGQQFEAPTNPAQQFEAPPGLASGLDTASSSGLTGQNGPVAAPHESLQSAGSSDMQGGKHDAAPDNIESDLGHPNKRARVEPTPAPVAQTVSLAQAPAGQPTVGAAAATDSATSSMGGSELPQQAANGTAEADGPRFEIVDDPPDSGDESDSGSDSDSD